MARVGVPAELGPFTLSDPGTGGHRATALFDGRPATTTVDGSTVRVTATFPAAGAIAGSLTVCDDVPSGACVEVPVTVDVDPGPVLEAAVPAVAAAAGGTRVLLTGRHLEDSTAVRVGDSEVPVVSATGDVVAFDMPPGPVGSSVSVAVVGATGTVEVRYQDLAARAQRVFTPVDTPVSIELSALDGGSDQLIPTGHDVVTAPANGRLGPPPAPGDPDPTATPPSFLGSVVYTPNAGFVGTDSFVVRVVGDTRTATVTVKVGNVAPTAGADSVSAQAGQVSVIDTTALLANDDDPDAADWPTLRTQAWTTGLQVVAVYPGTGMPGRCGSTTPV